VLPTHSLLNLREFCTRVQVIFTLLRLRLGETCNVLRCVRRVAYLLAVCKRKTGKYCGPVTRHNFFGLDYFRRLLCGFGCKLCLKVWNAVERISFTSTPMNIIYLGMCEIIKYANSNKKKPCGKCKAMLVPGVTLSSGPYDDWRWIAEIIGNMNWNFPKEIPTS